MPSFSSECDWRCVVGFVCERPLPDKPSKELDLLEISRTPGAYQQVQSQVQMFKNTESPFKRLGHQRNHYLAGLERAQKPSSDRSFRVCIGSQMFLSFDRED